jgi:Methyltransferase domain
MKRSVYFARSLGSLTSAVGRAVHSIAEPKRHIEAAVRTERRPVLAYWRGVMNLGRVTRYLILGRRSVKGWLSRVDGEVFSSIMLNQTQCGVVGNALEIGVHHGQSFILQSLCMTNSEVAVAVDIFGNQELNIDGSGAGSLAAFKRNVDRFGVPSNVKILSSSSLDLKHEHLVGCFGKFRFVHIDGGHWLGAVVNDLRLAAHCAGPDCVIALDDMFNADFPDVAAGYYAWMQEGQDFVPFCATQGKLFLCRSGRKQSYISVLMQNRYLRLHFKKNAKIVDNEIALFTGRYGGVSGLVRQYLTIYAPSMYVRLKALKKGRQVRKRETTSAKADAPSRARAL